MSVNPDMADNGAPTEFVDLEHQVIRQKSDLDSTDNVAIEVLPGSPAAEFEPGERQLDREEIAQLVVYRRSSTLNFLDASGDVNLGDVNFAIVDASVGINGDLFRSVTTQESFQVGPDNQTVLVDTGGEIGLLDNYQLYAQPQSNDLAGENLGAGGIAQRADLTVNFYDYPTGGPIVDSFDTITCGFAGGFNSQQDNVECQLELRYDFWWDVRDQGRSTNPFGRPSTR